MTLVGIPIFLLNLVVFSVLIYFSVRLQQSAGQFLYVLFPTHSRSIEGWYYSIFFLFLSIMSLTMQAWFRAVAAAFKSEATAQSVAGIMSFYFRIYSWA